MKRVFAMFTVFLVMAFAVMAQIPTAETPPSSEAITEPTYSAGVGVGFNRADSPMFKGLAFFDTRVAASTYSSTSLNVTGTTTTITTGVKRFFYRGSWASLFANANAGIATSSGATSATFVGEGGVKVPAKKIPFVGKLITSENAYWTGSVGGVRINGQGTSLGFFSGIGVDFR